MLEEMAAADDLFVTTGCDGCPVLTSADRDVIAVGSSGTVVEGRQNS